MASIQDPVHLAVKVKSRLKKPSIILPLGRYLAGVHHPRLIQAMFGTGLHGMRARDLDHKDKQNYDAVVHIIVKSVEDLLVKVLDSDGTIAYLSVISCVVESFLDMELPLTARIDKARYTVFFFSSVRNLRWLCIIHVDPNCMLMRN